MEAGNEANTWGLRCLNREQNPKIRVSSLAANLPSWGTSTRRVDSLNSTAKMTSTRQVKASNSASSLGKMQKIEIKS